MRGSPFPRFAGGPGQKLVSLVSGIVLVVVGLMFSVVLLAVVVVVGAAVSGYLWWKTREVGRMLRQRPVAPQAGHIIDGEAIVVTEADPSDDDVPPAAGKR